MEYYPEYEWIYKAKDAINEERRKITELIMQIRSREPQYAFLDLKSKNTGALLEHVILSEN